VELASAAVSHFDTTMPRGGTNTPPAALSGTEAVDQVARSRASLAAYKGHLTRAETNFDRQAALVLAAEPTTHAVAALETAYEEVNDRWKKVRAVFDDLFDADPDEADRYNRDRDEYEDKVTAVRAKFMEAHNRVFRRMSGPRAAPAAGAAGGAPEAAAGGQRGIREAKGLKPRELHYDDTHVTLRSWLEDFRAYYNGSKFEDGTDAERHAYFYACLDTKLAMRVRAAAVPTSAIFNTVGAAPDETSLESLLTKEFDANDSLFARRYRYLSKRHNRDQKLSDWYVELRAEEDECDLAAVTPDLLSALKLCAECADPVLKDELLKTDGSLEAVVTAMKAYEVRVTNKNRTKPGGSASNAGGGSIAAMRGNCMGCGSTCTSSSACPARGTTCNFCGKVGHWASVCKKKASQGGASGSSGGGRNKPRRKTDYRKAKERGEPFNGGNASGGAQQGSTGARPKQQQLKIGSLSTGGISGARNAPNVRLRINGGSKVVTAVPDTGACCSIISPGLVRDLDLCDQVNGEVAPCWQRPIAARSRARALSASKSSLCANAVWASGLVQPLTSWSARRRTSCT
jgi:hypothetical protein